MAKMKKRISLLATTLILCIIAYSMPWATTETKTYSGWQSTIPFGAFCIVGFGLSGISFKFREHIRLLNIIAGVFIVLGTILFFGFMRLFEFLVGWKIGSGVTLEFLLGIALVIVGIIQKPEKKR